MKDTLRKKLTLTGWMHNRKTLIAVSVLMAVVLWAVVKTQSPDLSTRSITVPVTVDLSERNFADDDLRLVGEVKENVVVVVKGPWSTISSMTAEDIRVRADVDAIKKPGKQKVALLASRNSNVVNYEIVSCTPAQLEIECDSWEETKVPLEIDASSLEVADPDTMLLKAPKPNVPVNDGEKVTVTVYGPHTTVKNIKKLIATVSEEEPLGDTKDITPELKAVDDNGKEVSLENCTINELADKQLEVRVEVCFYKDVTLDVEWHNAPDTIRNNREIFSVSPAIVKVIGNQDDINELSDTLVVDQLDFDHLVGQKYEKEVTVPLQDGVTLEENVAEVTATVTLDLSAYTKKTVTVTLDDSTVSFINNTEKKKTAVVEQKVNIDFYGSEEALENVSNDKARVTVDLAGTKEKGLKNTKGIVRMLAVSDGWFYYGENEAGIQVSVLLS